MRARILCMGLLQAALLVGCERSSKRITQKAPSGMRLGRSRRRPRLL